MSPYSAGLLAVLLASLLAGCSSSPERRPLPRNLPPVSAPTPEPPRPAIPLTRSAFLQPAARPTEHALGYSYLLLPWSSRNDQDQHRQQAACLALRLALQQAESRQKPTSSQLMPTYWPLEAETDLQDCGKLVALHDHKRARELLERPLSDQAGPFLVAWSNESRQRLVLDLARFSDADTRRVLMFWVREFGSEPQYWNSRGFVLPKIRQVLNEYVRRYGQNVLRVEKAD